MCNECNRLNENLYSKAYEFFMRNTVDKAQFLSQRPAPGLFERAYYNDNEHIGYTGMTTLEIYRCLVEEECQAVQAR